MLKVQYDSVANFKVICVSARVLNWIQSFGERCQISNARRSTDWKKVQRFNANCWLQFLKIAANVPDAIDLESGHPVAALAVCAQQRV